MESNVAPANQKNKLSLFQSAAIINGCGIGVGVVALPFFANKIGLWLALALIVVVYFCVFTIQLVIAELSIRAGKDSQMVDVISKSKLISKNKKVFSIVVFTLMAIIMTADLCSYVVTAADLLYDMAPAVTLIGWKIIFYVFAGFVALFGLKILGITEKYANILIFVSVASLIIASMFNLDQKINNAPNNVKDVFVYLTIVTFAFNSFFSVPHVVTGLNCDRKQIRKGINLGMFFNVLIVVTIMVFCLLSSKEITNPCVEGWSKSLGEWARIVGLIFSLLALLSSYWAISLSLRDVVHNQFNLNNRLCWAIATVPSLIFSIVISLIDKEMSGFNIFVSISSIVEAILFGIFVVPNFLILGKEITNKDNIFGKFGVILPAIVSYIVLAIMCVGGVINIIDEIEAINVTNYSLIAATNLS